MGRQPTTRHPGQSKASVIRPADSFVGYRVTDVMRTSALVTICGPTITVVGSVGVVPIAVTEAGSVKSSE